MEANQYKIAIIKQNHKHHLKYIFRMYISKHLMTSTPLELLSRPEGTTMVRKLYGKYKHIVKSKEQLVIIFKI